jgi:glycosyltransferase involved in cell wall biosynthesis
LQTEALGGTEATIVRIAEGLGATVAQHNRQTVEGRYVPYAAARASDDPNGKLIVVRDAKTLIEWHAILPRAKPYLWLHDLLGMGSGGLACAAPELARIGATLICVSDYHKAQAEAAVAAGGIAPETLSIHRIYNPIDDQLLPDATPVDRYKLVFLSAPVKGLAITLDAFRHIHAADSRFRLYIASPGYGVNRMPRQLGVHWLGSLRHVDVMKHVRSSLCVFYPNFVYPETFGLVLAESNAVGTPVLTHTVGAAPEVLQGNANQWQPVPSALAAAEKLTHVLPRGPWRRWLISAGGACGAYDAYLRVLTQWSTTRRPVVHANESFRLHHILNEWRALFRRAPGPDHRVEEPAHRGRRGGL